MAKTTKQPVLQRSISIYTFIGALQSAFCFFVLPIICKPLWPTIFDRFSPQIAEVLIWAMAAPYFLLYALLVALPPYLLEWDFFEQYKISTNTWPWKDKRDNIRKDFWRLTYKSICLDFVNIFIFFPCCVYAKTILFPNRNLSFSIDDWPTYWELGRDVLTFAITHEFGFYWAHRIIHAIPSLYKYHKVHHEYKQNDVLASQHFHPVDFFLSIATPVILSTIIIKPHSFTWLQAGLWIFTANLDDHLAYAFPWSSGLFAHYISFEVYLLVLHLVFPLLASLLTSLFPLSLLTCYCQFVGFPCEYKLCDLSTARISHPKITTPYILNSHPYFLHTTVHSSAGTDAHEFHHSVNMGCFGSKLSLWDWMFQTDQVYEQWRKKRWATTVD